MAPAVRIVVDIEHPDEELVARAVSALREGGTIAIPTETFYGLAVDARNPAALDRLWQRKGRDKEKAFPLIASSLDAVEAIAEVGPHGRILAERYWPGPLTLVLRALPGQAGLAATSTDGTIAVRVSSVALARKVSEALGGPITATSANRSGSRPARTATEVERDFGADIELILDGGSTPGGLPSTIVDVRSNAPRLVREGVVAFEDVVGELRK